MVLINRLRQQLGRIITCGLHCPDGQPIQLLSIVSNADCSHGVRLVHPVAQVNGERVSLLAALQDPQLALLSGDEGVIPEPNELLGQDPE